MNKPLMFSSESGEWETPPEIFNPLDKEFGFTLDVCASNVNQKCHKFFTKADDCFAHVWMRDEICWMNPVYGKSEQPCLPKCVKKKCEKRGHIDVFIPGISEFVNKAYWESEAGVTVVCLLPARTDTSWWHGCVMHAAEVRLVEGRIKFLENGKPKHPAPFPSAIVVFREHEGATRFSSWSP